MNKEKALSIRCTTEELAELKLKALNADLTLSAYVIKTALGYEVKKVDFEKYKELLAVAVDLKRIGNLFRLAISDRPEYKEDLAELIHQFSDLRLRMSNILYEFEQ